jgi:hypothetical protein
VFTYVSRRLLVFVEINCYVTKHLCSLVAMPSYITTLEDKDATDLA